MRKQQEEELRRLEEALLEAEYPEDALSEDPEEWETDWEESDGSEYYDVYNTDDVDVDLDDYSEEVHQGSGGSGAGVVIVMLTMILLSAGILLFLKYLGVL